MPTITNFGGASGGNIADLKIAQELKAGTMGNFTLSADYDALLLYAECSCGHSDNYSYISRGPTFTATNGTLTQLRRIATSSGNSGSSARAASSIWLLTGAKAGCVISCSWSGGAYSHASTYEVISVLSL